MGLNKNNNNGKFLGITNGKISLRVPEGTEGAVERETKNGDTVYEEYFDSVSGYIVGGGVERKKIGDNTIEQVTVKIKDSDGDHFTLNIPWASRVRDSFIKVLPNLDVSKQVEIVVFPSKNAKDKGRPVLIVKQDGSKVDWAYSRTEPNGLPQPTKRTVKGIETWDFSIVEDWLWSKGEEFFSQFDGDEPPVGQDESVDEESGEETQSRSGSDDIPF